jgi:putative hemolysin
MTMARLRMLPRRMRSVDRASATSPTPPPLGRLGQLEVRLARDGDEVKRAQRLRYQVFYEEMSAVANVGVRLLGRDRDSFDRYCDHLLVIDHGADGSEEEIVGTYRLLRQKVAEMHAGFYTAGEFDLAPMLRRHPGRNFLELGRSCVLKPYRNKRTVELLWHGIWSYVRQHDIDVMIGCASLEGTDLKRFAPALGFLSEAAPCPPEWQVKAQPGRGIRLADFASAKSAGTEVLRALPPLIKGYLRLGAYVGAEAVIDHQFGTTDVFLVLPNERINTRYINYYGAEATRYAASEVDSVSA